MKYDSIYELRQSAGRMEALLLAAGVLGVVATVIVFFAYGLVLAIFAFVLSLLAFAVSRLLDLFSELLGCVGRLEERGKAGQEPRNEVGP